VTPFVDGIAFSVLAALVVGGAVLMLMSRNVVHAAYWMLLSMLATAGLYLLLSAEFLALVQILVYAGAIAVLTIFTIMLTLRRREDAYRSLDTSLGGLALAVGLGAVLYSAIARITIVLPEEYPAEVPDTAAFGQALFTTWAVPFELASLVLLIALIGAVWWSLGGKDR
jgi:NADH-quinone oxidoreductase subunit J